MRLDERDAAYLWDMLDAARTIREFTLGIRLEDYLQDEMRQMAVEQGVEIIGEAARRICVEVVHRKRRREARP